MDEPVCELESEKATFEITAEIAGLLHKKAKTGDILKIGDVVCTIEAASEKEKSGNTKSGPFIQKPEVSTPETKIETPAAKRGKAYAKGHPSPAAARILEEKGLSPDQVKGSGIDERITKADALKAGQKEVPARESPDIAANKPAVSGTRTERRQRITTLRKTISKRLVAVKNETAMLTTFNEVDMQPIIALRTRYKEKFKEKYGVGLGYMSFFTKACCIALQEWPAVNASIDGDELVYHDYCDISIAVSTPKGLVVPVIRNAESLSFDGLETEILRLATKAREGRLSIEEMQGGTFSITNGGIFGSMMSTPIINAPQSAILGMHNIVERPVARDGEVIIRPIMYIALSYDHRIIDGRESVSFLVRVKELLEDPDRMLLKI
jgi:2-oxoglutarate dehydrogenase E2 component (dihydrolipoamide succinyltransferase)